MSRPKEAFNQGGTWEQQSAVGGIMQKDMLQKWQDYRNLAIHEIVLTFEPCCNLVVRFPSQKKR